MEPGNNTSTQTDKKLVFDKNISMEELLRRFPKLLTIITHNKLLCAGCFLARFHDISDAAFEHGLDEDKLYGELIAAVQANNKDTT